MIDEYWINFLKLHKERISKNKKSNQIEKKDEIKNKPKKLKGEIKDDKQ